MRLGLIKNINSNKITDRCMTQIGIMSVDFDFDFFSELRMVMFIANAQVHTYYFVTGLPRQPTV